jgi:5-methylcytosine-specific restriction endonuclease McrA
MSQAWAKGSTTAWRRTRAGVLTRDGYRCQLQLQGCTTKATQVHHTLGRTVTGDDPAHLVAACQHCNLKVGDPTRATDPAPQPRTRW